MSGIIFNIQRFSIHDGPGVRTTVFLKGCNLSCFWCHNPEAAVITPEIQFFPEKCIACGACVDACPHAAQELTGSQRIYHRDLCQECLICVAECFSGALVAAGRLSTPEEVVVEIERDKDYYRHSGGGVTFSGGEPLLQKDFLKEMLAQSKALGFHCAVDTAGNVPWEWFETILADTDLFLFDIKAFHAETHHKATGVNNKRILENLVRLNGTGKPVWIRIPVIPGINDTIEEVGQIAAFLVPLKSVQWVELLPFHTLGSEKYTSLGRDYPAQGLVPPSKEKMAELAEIIAAQHIAVRCMD